MVGLLWTRDQLVAETSDNTHHSQKTEIHEPGGIQTYNLNKLTILTDKIPSC